MEVGETTKDRLFTLQAVSCVGACALAPVVRVGDDETLRPHDARQGAQAGRRPAPAGGLASEHRRRRTGRLRSPRLSSGPCIPRAWSPTRARLEVRICAGTACHASGRVAVREAFKEELAARGLADEVRRRRDRLPRLLRAGADRRHPAQGHLLPARQARRTWPRSSRRASQGDGCWSRSCSTATRRPASRSPYEKDIPFYKEQRRLVLAHERQDRPLLDRRLPRRAAATRPSPRCSPTTIPRTSSTSSSARACAAAAAPASRPA